MIGSNNTTDMVVRELQNAIHAASCEYYKWSRGRIIYEDGIESLMQVYSARHLFEHFSGRSNTTIRLERPCKELVPDIGGRFDLTLEFDAGIIYAVEFKRYINSASIDRDLSRLRDFVNLGRGVGLLAAPCYMREREADFDWPLKRKQDVESRNLGQRWLLSEPREIEEHKHPDGWSHERALVVEVVEGASG